MRTLLIAALCSSSVALAQEPTYIINGEDAKLEDFPMTGGMLLEGYIEIPGFGEGDLRTFVCSSTLIAPDVVLLAAHCLDEDAFTMGFGSMDIDEVRWTRQADLTSLDGTQASPPWPEDAVVAWDWVVHPEWDIQQLQVGLAENHDIALLFLDEPLEDVPHAYLPTKEEAAQIEVGAKVTVVGWGQQVATDSPFDRPPAGTYAIKQIGTSTIAEVADFEFQVGELESDVRKCHGDSGGPTFLEVAADTTDLTRLVGVTSHAYDETDCAEKGGVDTRVDHYLTWIDEEMRARCDSGERAWCKEAGIVHAPEDKALACGCTAVPSPAGAGAFGVFLVGLLGLRRRR